MHKAAFGSALALLLAQRGAVCGGCHIVWGWTSAQLDLARESQQARARRARLDTTTKSASDFISPRRRSGEMVTGIQNSATIRWNAPLSPALSPLVPRLGEGARELSDGGCIKMRADPTRNFASACSGA